MARIHGTIGSLKALKAELKDKRIFRFSSVKEILNFLSNFNNEKLKIYQEAADDLENKYLETCTNLEQRIQKKEEIIDLETNKIDLQISKLQTRINSIHTTNARNFLKKMFSSIQHYFLIEQVSHLKKTKNEHLSRIIKEISINIERDQYFIKKYLTEKSKLIEKKAKLKIDELKYTKNVLENSKNLISGAIGENSVVNEIKKLSDDYILINDLI